MEQFCKSEQQLQIVKMHRQGMTFGEISRKLGVDRANARRAYKMVEARASLAGYAPDYDWTHPVPDGHKIKGVSTYYNADGVPTAQWVKSQTDAERQIEMLIERIEQAQEGLKPFKATKAPKTIDKSLLSLLVLTDYHLGMYAWESEAGEKWDLPIARDTFLNAISDMIDASPNSGVGMLCQLGDFLHWDGALAAVTPISGHHLDASGRYAEVVDLAISVMSEAIKMMLKKFGRVVVVAAEGNHDVSGSIWLRKYIQHMFKAEPRIEVIDSEFPYYAYLHGETMLAFHHGHKKKLEQLHKVFASEPRFREMWGKASYTYLHAGHLHTERLVEDFGYISERHPTLAARDAYATRGGWVSRRGAKVITYDDKHGEVGRVTVRPRS